MTAAQPDPNHPYGMRPTGAPAPTASPPAAGQPAGRRRAVSTGQILGGLLFVITVVFILENTRSVRMRLIIPEITAPLAVPIVVAAVLGAMIAALLRYRRHRRHDR